MKESIIENKVCEYAKNKGWLVYKFTSPGNISVPDRIFIRREIIFMIEFKAEGKKPTKLQEKTINKIKNEKIEVFIIDNIDKGIKIINSYEFPC